MSPPLHDFDLVPERRGVFFLISFAVRAHGLDALLFDPDGFIFGVCEFGGRAPYLAPVAIAYPRGVARTDGVEHPFRGVGVGGTICAVAAEIVQ